MERRTVFILFTLAMPALLTAAPKTMRVDYYHTGSATEEHFSLDRVVVEPLEWPGNPARASDDTNLGKYFFEVADGASGKTLFSRGFASVYGEWETTGEAKERMRTFHESLRFPRPDAPVRIVVKKRDAKNVFKDAWTLSVDPKDMFVDDSRPPSPGPLMTIEKHGDPADKVDFLILGDGYTAAERGKFEKDARRLAEILFAVSPFAERRSDFNVWGLCPPAEESGISRPSTGIHRRSSVGATYDAFGSERYILTFENRSLRDVASFAPYEFIEVLTNSKTYGGGGIFNLYSTVAADSLWSPYVFVHEFGHHFAGLADEYFTSEVAYGPAGADRVEPWEPNVTALHDVGGGPSGPPAGGSFKWKDLVSPGTPLPTPWKKEAFEASYREYQIKRRKIRAENRPEEEMDALFAQQKKLDTALLSGEKYAGKVGAFEGAMYEAKGYYRPQADCIMFSRDDVPFCAVCRRAISRVIDFTTGRDSGHGTRDSTKSK
jgi:IgA peptidase M64/peptidase M64-like protein